MEHFKAKLQPRLAPRRGGAGVNKDGKAEDDQNEGKDYEACCYAHGFKAIAKTIIMGTALYLR